MNSTSTDISPILQDIKSAIGGVSINVALQSNNENTITVPPGTIPSVLAILKQQHGYKFLIDLCGVDKLAQNSQLEVVYQLFNDVTNSRVRIKTQVAEHESVPTITHLWRGANWLEREAWDMFGIQFAGHPDMRRILTHHEFVGHPLRKSYPANQQQRMSGAPLEHFFERDRERLMKNSADDFMWINIGPAHPATHGTLRLMAVIDGGEKIQECDCEIGYLHRCFEKMCETHNYNQIIPYTDRLNYCSSPMNNNAYALTIEKLLGVEAPPRAQMIRMILDELSRIIDHFVCIGTNAVDLGAITGFLYLFHDRENVYNLFEKICGARLTVSLTRIGGLGFDLPKGWVDEARIVLNSIEKSLQEFNNLVLKNRVFRQRTKGVGVVSIADAIDFGYTGPCLRATGYGLDLRKTNPYYFYNQVDFDIPVGTNGDVLDRFLVRAEEVRQSVKIIRWCLNNLPEGPIKIDDKTISLPDKKDVYGNIEGLMNHFMLIINGVKPPIGEVYSQTEAANGELGFYVVSDGTSNPYRIKCRAPCFAIMSGFSSLVKGIRLADAVASLGSMNIVAGELDR